MPGVPFADRMDAGRRLADRLAGLKEADPLVLALPRGGVPVAHVIAERLGADLDLLMVRKIGVPWQPELALAAVVDGDQPQTVVNDEVAQLVPVPPDYLRKETERQLREIEARRARYLGDRKPFAVTGRTVVVVDDGIATGASMRAALKALRRQRPARLVVATPLAPADIVEQLRSEADEVVCLASPDPFLAIGMHYGDFAQTSDEEVGAIMARHHGAGDA